MPKGSKILMADDDQMLLDMYKERLDLAGYNVIACPNGEELMKKVHEFVPDMIMLDVMMPKMDGYATLAALKSDPQTKNIPVVMLTALMRDFNREKAIDTGADDYLIKSEAMPSDVITKIEQVLGNYNKGFGATQTPPTVPTGSQDSFGTTSAAPAAPIAPPIPETPPAPPMAPDVAPATAETKMPTGWESFNDKPEDKPAEETANIEFKPEEVPNGPMIETEPIGVPPAPPMAPTPQVIEDVKKPLEERPPIDAIKPVNQVPLATESTPPAKGKSYRALLTIIIIVLLTTLINDLVMYFLFIAKK